MPDVLQLPTGLSLDFIAEGGANVVYGMTFTSSEHISKADINDPASISFNSADLQSLPDTIGSSTPPPTEIEPEFVGTTEALPENLKGKLLRLHKDVQWIRSYETLHHKYQSLIVPYFENSQIIAQDLISLPFGLVQACNAALRHSEGNKTPPVPLSHGGFLVRQSKLRDLKRRGLYLSETEQYGLLIDDMSVHDPASEILVELKPKWLVQSPNAPSGSKRCRTCALRAMRGAKKTVKAHSKEEEETSVRVALATKQAFCPLELVSNQNASSSLSAHPDIFDISTRLLNTASPPDSILLCEERLHKLILKALIDYLSSTALFEHLASLQQRLDPMGILHLDFAYGNTGTRNTEEDEKLTNFLIATTLRDCTLFVKLKVLSTETGTGEHDNTNARRVLIDARLGDLDLKEAEPSKVEYWKSVERNLIDGGWYEGLDGAKTYCVLEREYED